MSKSKSSVVVAVVLFWFLAFGTRNGLGWIQTTSPTLLLGERQRRTIITNKRVLPFSIEERASGRLRASCCGRNDDDAHHLEHSSKSSSNSIVPNHYDNNNRRRFLARSVPLLGVIITTPSSNAGAATIAPNDGGGAVVAAGNNNNNNKDSSSYPVKRDPEEWQSMLSPLQYDVLWNAETEKAFSSPLAKETRTGRYSCVGCQEEIFDSGDKFDSGTGWPSFSGPLLASAVEIETKIIPGGIKRLSYAIVTRREVRCATCGGHLGHVFDDGFLFFGTTAFETNNRFCINGAVLSFQSSSSSSSDTTQ